MKYEKGSFVVIPNKHQLRELSLGARAVFFELCDMCDDIGTCFPSRKLLSERIRMSEDSVDRFIKELVDAGLISKVSRHRTDGSPNSNLYQLLLLPPRTDTQRGGGTGAALTVPTLITQKPADADSLEITEEILDKDGNPRLTKGKGSSTNEQYEELCQWAENRRGFPFLNRKKQYAALKKSRLNNISIPRVKQRWIDTEGELWLDGFDWTTVVNSFDRKS